MMPDSYHPKYDLRQLRAFLAIAKRLSFRKAADDLHIAQPALSRQIAQLEEAVGCKLFHRQKQRIGLTQAGEYLYRVLPSIFEQLEAHIAQTYKVACGQTASLVIGYSGAAMSSFLPAVIREIRHQLNDCEFEFREETSDKLIEGVITGRLDTAFILYRPDNPLLTTIPIRSEPIGLILPDDHPLAQRKKVPLKALKNETLILFPRSMNPVMYDEIIAACQDAGFSPRAIREVAPRSIAIGLVAAGVGVATIASSLQHTCVKGTCYRPLTTSTPQIRFSCITRSDQDGEWHDLLSKIIDRDLRA